MEIILDTNFILACIENKSDFFDLEREGEIVIPREVVDELEEICEEGDLEKRQQAEVAIKIIAKSKDKIIAINLDNSYVDGGIESYIQEHTEKEFALGTLDKKLMARLKGKARFVSLVNRKKFVVV